ncbi:MAG TPA: FAD-binding oxidoreductase, partial [Longimicrobiales bacterium]
MLEALRSAIPQISVRGAVADFRVHDVEPNMVVEPRSAEEAAAVLKLASENDWRVECAGMNTQGYGNRRTRADIVISTRAMTAIVEYEPADLVIGVQAGMPLHQLQRETRKNAQFLPLDPAREEMATIGGTLAAALSGPLRYAHGTARDHVLGLQVVTGDGRILQLGGRVVKNVAGYDLVRLLVGSAGTLGLITSAYLRLKPLPQADETLQISAAEPQPLLELARYITTANLEAVALELLDAGALTESWLLLVRLAG